MMFPKIPKRNPVSVTVIQRHVEQASLPRLLDLLEDVSSWPVLPHDPTQAKRNAEALRLLEQTPHDVETADPARGVDGTEQARAFLHGLCGNAYAQHWEGE